MSHHKPKDEHPQFRTTLWPDGHLEVPLVFRAWPKLVSKSPNSDDWRITTEEPDWTDYAALPVHEIPSELAIRKALPIAHDDREAVLGFIAEHGHLSGFPSYNEVTHLDLLPMAWRDNAKGRRANLPDNEITDWEIGLHLIGLQAVVNHWRSHVDDDEDQMVAAWKPLLDYVGIDPESDFKAFGPGVLGGPVGEAWDRWESWVNAALSPLSVGVTVSMLQSDSSILPLTLPRRVTAYTAMMVQIFSDVQDRTEWCRCVNETCGQLFGRQTGRATAGQYRLTGVLYCSRNCARAQAERNRRRKEKASKQSSEGQEVES